MTLSLAAKKAVVKEVTEVASKAISAVVADYRGLSVNQMTQLRAKARKSGVYLRVVPNTLTRRAFEKTEFACLSDLLVGPLFVALSLESPGDAARLLKEFTKTFEKLKIKALAVGGKRYGAEHLDAIARLPTRDEAIAKLMYVMRAPIEKFVRTLNEPHAKLVRTIAAVKEQKEKAKEALKMELNVPSNEIISVVVGKSNFYLFEAVYSSLSKGVAAFEKHKPIFEVIGEKIFHVGKAGNGATVKLLTNLLWFVTAATIGEALMLGAKADIPLNTVWEAIKSSAGNSWVAEHDVPSIFAGHYDPSFSLALCCKDLGLINDIAHSQGYSLPMGAHALALFEKAKAQYGPDAAELHVVKLLEDRVGHYLRPSDNAKS